MMPELSDSELGVRGDPGFLGFGGYLLDWGICIRRWARSGGWKWFVLQSYSYTGSHTMEDKKIVLESASSEELENGAVQSAGWDQKATKQLIRKIDWVLIPWLAFLYL